MPSSPILGLSMLVHLVVILAHRAFHWTEYKTERVARELGVSVYFIGCLIIGVIFFLVSILASFLVTISLVDTHSNIQLVQRVLPEVVSYDYSGAYAETLSAVPSAQSFAQVFHSVSAYEILFFLSVASLIVILLEGESVAKGVTYIHRHVRFRKFFVGMGIVVLFVGTASFFVYIISVDSVAAYFTEPKFGLIFGK